MAKKKSRAKVAKRSAPKTKAESCCKWHSGMVFAKLSAMAFILFLITVWPAAMDLVHGIHWGWFLIATIVFGALAMTGRCCK